MTESNDSKCNFLCFCTLFCKRNANSWLFMAFRRNFAWNHILTKFPCIFVTPIVLIRMIFRMIIRFARWFTSNFRAIIRSSRKVAAISQTITCSSWKFDLLFINRPRAFWNTVCWLKYLNDLSNYWARKKPLRYQCTPNDNPA